MSDELIDRRLEFLYQRWQRMVVADDKPADMEIFMRHITSALAAYWEAVDRYGREAPSAREQYQQDNAAWN